MVPLIQLCQTQNAAFFVKIKSLFICFFKFSHLQKEYNLGRLREMLHLCFLASHRGLHCGKRSGSSGDCSAQGTAQGCSEHYLWASFSLLGGYKMFSISHIQVAFFFF